MITLTEKTCGDECHWNMNDISKELIISGSGKMSEFEDGKQIHDWHFSLVSDHAKYFNAERS